MKNTNTCLHKLNRRQRKKHHLGEFQEFVFEIAIAFKQAMDEAQHDRFLDDLIDFIESRDMLVAGLGGRYPISDTDGVIQASDRPSPSDEDRSAVRDWLLARPEVHAVTIGDLRDAWYGWDE